MAEQLLVRFRDNRQESLEWLSVNGLQSQLQSGSLQDLADAAQGREIFLLLPASAALLLEIELPLKSNAQIKKALPFALEDLLADDVENYHLVWLRQPQNKLAVAAVAHDKLLACIERFRQGGLELAGIYPEPLCLPYRPGTGSVLIDQDQAILRLGQWQGGGIDVSFLPQFLGQSNDDRLDRKPFSVWAGQAPADIAFEYIQEPFSTPLQLFAEGYQAGVELNLLSGPYAPQHKETGNWRQWAPVFAIAAIALIMQFGALLNQNWQQRNSLLELEAQTMAFFKQTFPDVKRVVNVKAQADQQLAELRKRGAHTSSGFMRMLYQSGEILKDNPAMRIRKLNFVNGGLQMQLNAADIGQLQQFEQALQTKHLVKIHSADSGANGVEAQLEIREK